MTFLKSCHLMIGGEMVRCDVYLNDDKLYRQAVKAKASTSGTSVDGALLVKVIRKPGWAGGEEAK